VKRVRNKRTGFIHEVNDDHWALRHPDYEVLEDEPKEANEPNESKERKRKGR